VDFRLVTPAIPESRIPIHDLLSEVEYTRPRHDERTPLKVLNAESTVIAR
jgi:hypothetical protein